MYKVLVYQDRVAAGNQIQTRCYVFQFDTKEAAQLATTFYLQKGCDAKWVRDSKE